MDEVEEGLDGQAVCFNGLAKCDVDRVTGFTRIHSPQAVAPPRQQLEAALAIAYLVSQVISPAAEAVDVVEVLVQAPRQKGAGHMKVLIVIAGQPAGVGKGRRHIPGRAIGSVPAKKLNRLKDLLHGRRLCCMEATVVVTVEIPGSSRP